MSIEFKNANLLGAVFMLLACFHAAPARAETGWLEWANRGIFEFNQNVSATVAKAGVAVPDAVKPALSGLGTLGNTYVSEPLNALAHLIAGRQQDSLVALKRIGINVTRGWLGLQDRAREEGLVTNPIDFGLALCVRGVPPGPFVVLPLAGVRTLRDGLSDWVAAHAIIYGLVFGAAGVPVSVENLVMLEAVEEVATLAVAGELGEMPADAVVNEYRLAQQRYLAGRQRRCAELAADRQ